MVNRVDQIGFAGTAGRSVRVMSRGLCLSLSPFSTSHGILTGLERWYAVSMDLVVMCTTQHMQS